MDTPAKQQAAERIKQANKILVTVSTNPSVDQLASAIGLTLLLNRMGKQATAVFSGKVPSTIEFLQPEKTLVTNTDSLRDFIISLDKAKADKLRYKVEDQVVRIFITPYHTSLSEKDLVFSQGDFNVEVVMALGVKDKNQLDSAITAHGRILHDATVISAIAGQQNNPRIGQINWQEPQASSLSEMLVSISEAFGPGLIDNQIATAFLTGIVAETERFSNAKTSPKVMTMSAQLMAAGANQQLIVSKLDQPPPPPSKKPPQGGGQQAGKKPPPKPAAPKANSGLLNVSHDASKADSPEVSVDPNEIHIDEQGNLTTAAEREMQAKQTKATAVLPVPPPLPPAPEPEPAPVIEPAPAEPSPPVPEPAPLPPLPTPPPPPPPPIPTSQPVLEPPRPYGREVQQNHSILNPAYAKPSLSTSFTANTSDETKPAWAAGDYSAPYDPLSDDRPGSHDYVIDRGSPMQAPQSDPMAFLTNRPPETGPSPTANPMSVDEARKAVEMIAATQMDYNRPAPLESLGAAPMGPELHQPPPVQQPVQPWTPGATPTLSLPQNGNSPPPPAPPPLPPLPPSRPAA